jgi:rhodanese-related sulfurtransferase
MLSNSPKNIRSKQAAGILAKNGYTEIIHLLDELDRSKEIYAYCQVGVRGYIASRILQQQGFDVKNLTGGYRTYDIARFTPAADV